MHRILAGFILSIIFVASAIAQTPTMSTLDQNFLGSGGVSVGPDGNIYVANFGLRLNNANGTELWQITPDGTRTLFSSGFSGASGHAWDSQGNLFQANIGAGRIDKVTSAGVRTAFTSAGIAGPVGVAVDSQDNIFVANCGNNTIQKLTQAAVSTQFAADGRFNCPNGLTIDENDNLYTANFGNGAILKIDPQGVVSLVAVTPSTTFRPGGGNGHLVYANGVLYVASNANSQIFEITLDGQMKVLAGTGVRGHQDGPVDQATFSMPNGIAASADGRFLYFNESESLAQTVLNGNTYNLTPNRLRVIDLGQTETFTINPGLNGSWFNQATSGQGFFLDVFPDIPLVFLAWFTYDTTDQSGGGAVVGDSGHRWITAQGAFDGNTATLDVTLTSGGLFDDPTPATNSTPGSQGTITVTFDDCIEGMIDYDLTAIGLSGSVPITRIAGDNIPLCESLASGAAK